MKQENIAFSATWLLAACLLLGGCGNAQEQPSTQATPDDLTGLSQLSIQSGDTLLFTQAEPSDENLTLPATIENAPIKAYSFIETTPPLSTIKSYQPETLLHLSLDENLIVTARINRNQPIGDNIRTLSGPILDPHTGNVILSIDEEAVTGSIDLLSENRLFYIRYDSASGHHYLAEIDRSELDILEGSAPLEYQ